MLDELDKYLTQQGYSAVEVKRIVSKLEEYDNSTLHDSIFDSFENGTFTLGHVIKESIDELKKADPDEESAEPDRTDA